MLIIKMNFVCSGKNKELLTYKKIGQLFCPTF